MTYILEIGDRRRLKAGIRVLPEGQKRAGTPASTAHTPVIRRQAAPAMPTEAGQAAPPGSRWTASPNSWARSSGCGSCWAPTAADEQRSRNVAESTHTVRCQGTD